MSSGAVALAVGSDPTGPSFLLGTVTVVHSYDLTVEVMLDGATAGISAIVPKGLRPYLTGNRYVTDKWDDEAIGARVMGTKQGSSFYITSLLSGGRPMGDAQVQFSTITTTQTSSLTEVAGWLRSTANNPLYCDMDFTTGHGFVRYDGVYNIGVNVGLNSQANARFAGFLQVNSDQYPVFELGLPTTARAQRPNGSMTIRLAAGDDLSVKTLVAGGTTPSLQSGGLGHRFSMARQSL